MLVYKRLLVMTQEHFISMATMIDLVVRYSCDILLFELTNQITCFIGQ